MERQNAVSACSDMGSVPLSRSMHDPTGGRCKAAIKAGWQQFRKRWGEPHLSEARRWDTLTMLQPLAEMKVCNRTSEQCSGTNDSATAKRGSLCPARRMCAAVGS